MKVLVLSNCALDETQGSGYVIMNTSRCLMSLGYKVDLIPPAAFSFLPSLKNRAKVYRMYLGVARWVYKQRRIISNYNLVIFYGAESSLALFLIKKIFKLDIPILLHSNGLELSAKNNLKKFKECDADAQSKKWFHINNSFLFTYCYKKVNAILTVSRYDAEFAKNDLGIAPEKVFYIEPCLPEVYLQKTNCITEKKAVITYCGRWTPYKGKASMEFAIPKILNRFPDFTFRIIGAGDGFSVSDYFPKELHNRIEVYPYVKNKEQLLDLYRSTSILLFPSLTEGFGLVVIEAMINGCSVICGPTGIGGDLKNLDEAMVLNVPNGKEVYSAIQALILDDQLRLKLSINGKKRVENLQWKNFSRELLPVLDFLMKKT